MASSEDLSKDNEDGSSTDSNSKDSFWTPGRIVITLIAFALIVWYGIAEWRSKGTTAADGPVVKTVPAKAPVITAAAPPVVPMPEQLRNTVLQTLDGSSLKLSDFADKVVVLNIWAVWCGPCRLEMPELIKMSNEYKARGLVVVGLATSYNEDKPQVKEYVQLKNIPYKVIFDDGTLEASLVELVHAQSVIPQSFIISRDSRIVRHFQGFSPASTPQSMRQAIENALND